ncbi:MFS transporter [Ruminococcaceae bacterium OttesenSCG-928-L11]|nr:MFS transporter [Ruminococcaceae bacterium OttesenSCG-928-L11]
MANAANGLTGKKRWIYLLVGTVMMIILGLVYAWSVFVAPLEAEFGWDRVQTSLTFTICMCCFTVGLFVGGILSKRLSKRIVVVISAVFLLAGFGLCSRISTLTGLYITYGVLVGFGVGVANNALVSTIVSWFPDKTGLASGILMMGFGLGGFILSPLAVRLMATIGWRTTFLGFGVVFAALIAAGAAVVVMPPKQERTPAKATSPDTSAQDVDARGMLVSKPLWLFLGWFVLLMAGGMLVIGQASPYAQSIGATEGFAAVAVGILSLSNGAGRIVTGIVFDKWGFDRSMRMTMLYLAAGAALLIASAMTGSLALMAVGFVFTGLAYGGGPSTCSAFTMRMYGPTHFAMNYAVASIGMVPAALVGPMLAGALYQSSGGYLTSFVAMLLFSVPAMGFAIWLSRTTKSAA